MQLFESSYSDHLAMFKSLLTLRSEIESVVAAISGSLKRGSKILLCGNGGSAADCQHIAAELTGRLYADRRPLAAVALTTDSSALTCIGNDYGFDYVFSRQVLGLGRAGDCLIGISTSGKSLNVINAFQAAKTLGMTRIGLLGRDGGALRSLCDYALVVPVKDTARIQEAHIFLAHVICAEIEAALGLTGTDGKS